MASQSQAQVTKVNRSEPKSTMVNQSQPLYMVNEG